MRYKIRYYFGDNSKDYECKEAYEMEKVIEFMREKWNLEPAEIFSIKEKDKTNGDDK